MNIGLVAGCLWTRMNSIVFCTSCRFQIERIITLQSMYVCSAQRTCQERILTISLHTSTPTRVTKDIHVWRPKRKTSILRIILQLLCYIELSTTLCRNRITNLLDKLRIKSGSQTDWLRKYGSTSVSPHAMKRFVPPVIWFDVQAIHTWRNIHQLR